MTEGELTSDMEALIGEAPRTWKEILQNYNGQPYPVVYRAFSNLRPRLGRCDDAPCTDTRSRTVTLRLRHLSRPFRISIRATECRRGHVRPAEVTLLAQTGRNPGEMPFRCGELCPCSPGYGLLSRLALQLTLGGHG